MTALDRELLAERTATLERHLARVAMRLPRTPDGLAADQDAADAVILHLWQAMQIVIDLALSACSDLRLGTPASYADAFRRLGAAGKLDQQLAERLVRAAGLRDVLVHAYDRLDLARVHRAASEGPRDLRAFLAALRDLL
jgi:uncharacterized protein YutE (UPF0331/DUF86 family)